MVVLKATRWFCDPFRELKNR